MEEEVDGKNKRFFYILSFEIQIAEKVERDDESYGNF